MSDAGREPKKSFDRKTSDSRPIYITTNGSGSVNLNDIDDNKLWKQMTETDQIRTESVVI